ncbi:MAG: dual specificity protein phosphatase family protein, partial [Clostridia bacterium]|nr:dual specificity protein phosphatase family protein [Clostridia bacterium]
ACAEGKRVIIIDLRQESHGFVNGIPISWYGLHNWANVGMSLEEIERDEQERFEPMVGTVIKAYGTKEPVKETEIHVEHFMTERELVESEGFEYFRLPIQDHTWPAPDTLDTFIEFVKDKDDVWLHFHCQAGKGRTGILMMVYDMMKNPQLAMEDIVVRQTMLGGSYPLYTEDNYKAPYYAEKARMTPLFYEYVHAVNYEVSWSEWLSEKEEIRPKAGREEEIRPKAGREE